MFFKLQNLLTAKLDDFNFDESTINSSTNISAVSIDELQNKYCDVTNPHEQMKVLYDVRLREINSLREEYENYKKEKIREIDQLKNKMFMYEAEVQQLKITLKNSEELLGNNFLLRIHVIIDIIFSGKVKLHFRNEKIFE